MNESRHQRRVGLFVLACLVLMGALMLIFSKGTGLLASSYEIKLRLKNVGGLKERSAVFLAGVQVGNLKSADLAPDGLSVVLHLRILKQFSIKTNASFKVEQIGMLGDQFVSIYPKTSAAPLLKDGDEVQGQESFNLGEVAQSAEDLIKQLTETLGEVRGGLTNIRHSILDPTTLYNLSNVISNFRQVSEHGIVVMSNVSGFVQSNSQPLSQSISNVNRFSQGLEPIARHLDETILANRSNLTDTIASFKAASASISNIAAGLETGQGVAGSLLKDARLQAQMNSIVSELSVAASNLSHYGLLYKPKAPRPVKAYTGKTP